jgi:phosphoribosylformylglycinamidine synthase subunit PurL
MAITNNLNFGNPKKPEVYFQLSEAIAGMGEACTVLETPVTGGNVSLYNESPQGAIHPTPTIGMVGLVESMAHITPSAFQRSATTSCCWEIAPTNSAPASICSPFTGSPSANRRPVIRTERALIDALLEAIRGGAVRSAHDCSDGGLAVALAECAMMDRERSASASPSISRRGPPCPIAPCCSARRTAVSWCPRRQCCGAAGSAAARRAGPGHRAGDRGAEAGASVTISDDTFTAPVAWLAKAFHEAIPQAMDGETPAEHVVAASHAPTND